MTAQLSNINTPKKGHLGSLLQSKPLLKILEKNLGDYYSGSPGITTKIEIPAEQLIDIAKNTIDQINDNTLTEKEIISEAINDPTEISNTDNPETQNTTKPDPEETTDQNPSPKKNTSPVANSEETTDQKNDGDESTNHEQETSPSQSPTETPESQEESENQNESENTPQPETPQPASEPGQSDNPQQTPSKSDSPNQESPQNNPTQEPTNQPQIAPPTEDTNSTPNNDIPFPQKNKDETDSPTPQSQDDQPKNTQEEPNNETPKNVIPTPNQQNNPNSNPEPPNNQAENTENAEPKEKSALEQKGGELGKELGSEAGKVAGQEIGGPVGGAVGDYLGGKIGEKSGKNAGKKINDTGEKVIDTAKDKAENLINPDFQNQENQNANQLGKDKTQSRRRKALEDIAAENFDFDKFVEQEGLDGLKHKNALGDKASSSAEGVGKQLGAELLNRIKTGSFKAFVFAMMLAVIKDAWDIVETFLDGGIFTSLLNIVIGGALSMIMFIQFGWMKRIIINTFLRRIILVVLAEFIPLIGFVPFYTLLILYIKHKSSEDIKKHHKALKKLEKSFGNLEKKSKHSQTTKRKINLKESTIAKRAAQANQ